MPTVRKIEQLANEDSPLDDPLTKRRIEHLITENAKLTARLNCLQGFLEQIPKVERENHELKCLINIQREVMKKVTGIDFDKVINEGLENPVQMDNAVHLLASVIPHLIDKKVSTLSGKALMDGEYGDGAIYSLPGYKFLQGPSQQGVEVYQQATWLVQYVKSCLLAEKSTEEKDKPPCPA